MASLLTVASQIIPKAKSAASDILTNVQNTLSGVTGFIRGNPILSTGAVGTGSALVGATVATVVTRRSTKKRGSRKSTTKRKTKRRKKTKSKRRKSRRKSYKYARTAGKRKDRSTKRIRMTKNGQPYIILKSGKARFIKKSSARRSRKLKGGRY